MILLNSIKVLIEVNLGHTFIIIWLNGDGAFSTRHIFMPFPFTKQSFRKKSAVQFARSFRPYVF